MPSVREFNGGSSNVEDAFRSKSTAWELILTDLLLKINKSVYQSSLGIGEDGYIGLINLLEDLLYPYLDDHYYFQIQNIEVTAKKTLKDTKGYSDAELFDEGFKELNILISRAKFKALCSLMSRSNKTTVLPYQTLIDEI